MHLVRPEFAHFRIFLVATQKLMERIKRGFQGRCAYKSPIYPENHSPQFPIVGVWWVFLKIACFKIEVHALTLSTLLMMLSMISVIHTRFKYL